jgi:hypothetical protein
MWGALSDERTSLSFTIAAGARQRSHSRVRVPWDSRPYFTVSDLTPSTTRRATVEVFDPASTRDQCSNSQLTTLTSSLHWPHRKHGSSVAVSNCCVHVCWRRPLLYPIASVELFVCLSGSRCPAAGLHATIFSLSSSSNVILNLLILIAFMGHTDIYCPVWYPGICTSICFYIFQILFLLT